MVQSFDDKVALDFGDGLADHRYGPLPVPVHRRAVGHRRLFGHIEHYGVGVDFVFLRQQDRTMDSVLQFSNIAAPCMRAQALFGFGTERFLIDAVRFGVNLTFWW